MPNLEDIVLNNIAQGQFDYRSLRSPLELPTLDCSLSSDSLLNDLVVQFGSIDELVQFSIENRADQIVTASVRTFLSLLREIVTFINTIPLHLYLTPEAMHESYIYIAKMNRLVHLFRQLLPLYLLLLVLEFAASALTCAVVIHYALASTTAALHVS